MKFLMVGDIVGDAGRTVLKKYLDNNKKNYDFIIVNGENAASGFGITAKIAKTFFEWGVDVITLGNHTYDRRDVCSYLDEEKKIIRPYNFHKINSGHGYVIVKKNNTRICVVNIQGKVFMQPIFCPFLAMESLLEKIKDQYDILIVDFHAEATSEKQAMGWHLVENASVVYGTHTHTQTSDNKILNNYTGFITDIGMTGGHNGVLGMNKKESLERLKYGFSSKYVPCDENPRLNGIECEIDDSGRCTSIKRLDIGIDEI